MSEPKTPRPTRTRKRTRQRPRPARSVCSPPALVARAAGLDMERGRR